MARAAQKRTLETRARLVAAANAVIDEVGYQGLRVEHVVLRAGVAKGTFFAHFRDKDALMELLIGSRINTFLDQIETLPAPQSVDDMTDALMPMMQFMTCERYVFDVIMRYSGAAACEDIGTIATTFGRQIDVMISWLADGPFRKDISAELLAEGVQAFSVQAMALIFCALHNETDLRARMTLYLNAWLTPASW
ncbi:TetR/AcrR family transcriptional regulator [Shimia sp.]|uniref:TetR/AcrR family transcriptional regulator n=1 Tax=Shimia sp. TaxID=1954381 RepID=UPI003299C0A4